MIKPLISIILPTFNVEKYIERCLISCLAQSFESFEVIVVDDFSADKSIEIAKKYAVKDSRIKVIHNKNNLGTYHARKKGTLYSKGKYILFLDPDDELEINALARINNYLSKYLDLDLLLFNATYIPSLEFWKLEPKVPVGEFNKNVCQSIIREKKTPYGTMGKLYSKRVLIKSYDFLAVPEYRRLVYAEDVLLFVSSLIYVKTAVGIKDKLYIYHYNKESITKLNSLEEIHYKLEQLEINIQYLNLLASHPNYNKYLKKIAGKLVVDKLFMKTKLARSNKEYIIIMLKILEKDFSIRNVSRTLYFLLKSPFPLIFKDT